MMTRKRKINDTFSISASVNNISEISLLIDEIKNLLTEKNIFINEEIDRAIEKRNIIIKLLDKNNNIIGKINGGVEEYKIIENGEEIYKNALYIEWVKVEDNYKGYNLGIFLIIYFIYLCKINFSDIDYVVLEDDTDEIDPQKNIYVKLGFIYQETKEIQLDNGQIINVMSQPEMQLNIKDFLNNELIEKLNKIKIRLRNLVKYEGGKRKKKRRTRTRKAKKTKKIRKYRKSRTKT
jgi:hypothetical protein